MLTDWALIRRLGAEIESRIAGGRVQDAGVLRDGRVALVMWRPDARSVLAIDCFGSPPVVTLESEELEISGEHGFVRAMARALRGTRVRSISATRGDRLLRFVFGTRSRFGIADEIDLWVELVPRFGNAVLVKDRTVIAALKEFRPAKDGMREVAAGVPYAMPPLPEGPPRLPRLVVESGAEPEMALRFLESDDALRSELYAYRRAGRLQQAHLLPLPQLDADEVTREPSLLALLREDRAARAGATSDARTETARAGLRRRLGARRRSSERALALIAEQRAEAEGRDALRKEGDAIFSTLHELETAERTEAKRRATALFSKYRKLGERLARMEEREILERARLDSIRTLEWEAERAAPEDLSDVQAALDALSVPRRGTTPRRQRRGRLELRTRDGSRILVGRSPLENAELTFRIARPNDLWFHARGVPGAHVILRRDDRSSPSDADVRTAAAIAAGYSKARDGGKIVVDYTLRKHVRKQQGGAPGMVFYTNARSSTVSPQRLSE